MVLRVALHGCLVGCKIVLCRAFVFCLSCCSCKYQFTSSLKHSANWRPPLKVISLAALAEIYVISCLERFTSSIV